MDGWRGGWLDAEGAGGGGEVRTCMYAGHDADTGHQSVPGREEKGFEPKLNGKKGFSVFPLRPIQQAHRDKERRQDRGWRTERRRDGWGNRQQTTTGKK